MNCGEHALRALMNAKASKELVRQATSSAGRRAKKSYVLLECRILECW